MLITVVLSIINPLTGLAEEDYPAPLCSADLGIPSPPEVLDKLEEGDTFITADHADLIEEGVSHLEGNAEITRDTQQVRSDIIDYDKVKETADLKGNVNYWDETVYLHSGQSHLELDLGAGTFQDATYRLLDIRGRGTADELFVDAGTITRGKNIEFSTCDPDVEPWSLQTNFWKIEAEELVLNHETERGTGKHVILKIKDVPVFYTPYLTFPLGLKRKSGFLMPSFGSTNNNGVDIQTPYYWNISPNMDATFTPRLLTDSGLMGLGEYRYLFDAGGGILNVEYLASDSTFDDRDRSYIDFSHQQTFADTGNLSLIYKRVSDREYFEDLGTQLATTSTRYLQRLADVSYRGVFQGNFWNVSGRVQDFQIVDNSIAPTSQPYQRLPQIRFNMYSPRRRNSLNFDLKSQFAYFDRGEDQAFVNSVNGFRVDLFPSAGYLLSNRYAYLAPRIGLRYTQYNLTDSGPFNQSPSRILPSFNVDSGVFFERDLNLFGEKYINTLEPRAYYLYVPKKDQSYLPVFDTGIFNLSYNQLFRDDRFSSPDRMGDANQLTLAVTTRLINKNTGTEIGYFRVGQIFFLDDQEVIRQSLDAFGRVIDNGLINEDLLSPLVVEFGSVPVRDWSVKGEIHWDPNENVSEKMALSAQYLPEDGKVLNLAYRVRRAASGVIRRTPTDIDQTDISLRWPINRQWSVVGRWNYAISESKSLETFAGLEYDSCCWSVRAVGRRFLTNLNGDFQTGFFLQFELKGLAGLGQKTVDFLNQQIPGYQRGF